MRRQGARVKMAAKALAEEAMTRGSQDNISVVVIRFAPCS